MNFKIKSTKRGELVENPKNTSAHFETEKSKPFEIGESALEIKNTTDAKRNKKQNKQFYHLKYNSVPLLQKSYQASKQVPFPWKRKTSALRKYKRI